MIDAERGQIDHEVVSRAGTREKPFDEIRFVLDVLHLVKSLSCSRLGALDAKVFATPWYGYGIAATLSTPSIPRFL